jgi:schlafen family protein
MDFVDWCAVLLNKLAEVRLTSPDRRLSGVDQPTLAEAIFGNELPALSEYWGSTYGLAVASALEEMLRIGLVEHPEGDDFTYRPTGNARAIAGNFIPLWESICNITLQNDQKELLRTLNQMSERKSENHAWLEEVHVNDLMAELGWMDTEFFVSVADELERDGLMNCPGLHGNIATYRGLVWATRHGLTIESKRLDELVKQWETTSVEFKRELYMDTKDQKAEFVKDIVGLANTQASGQRLLIIGFDDKTREYHAPPDLKGAQDRMEQLLARCTSPMVDSRYTVIDYRSGSVGQIEVLRDPKKLPYRVKEKEGGKGVDGKRLIEENQIFVRHGSQTEEPTADELQAIIDEGDRARSLL